jgi:succinoglycan biosynthesis protein ExoM
MLPALLDSLARQTLAAGNDRIALVVVDNDPGRSAEAVFQEKSKSIPFPAICLSEPKRGIPFARNRILDEALSRNARYIAFIDDDEMATEDWLEQLYAVIRETGADAVQGPVRYVPEAGCAAWMAEELAWRSRRMQKHKEASVRPKLSTRNVIMSARLVSGLGLRFDESFALSGGSDVDFFYRAHQKGSKTSGPTVRW